MSEDRLIELETRMAYQEATLQQLNDIVTAQQRRLDQLERALRELASRVARRDEGLPKATAADDIAPDG
ncbi:SlyX family protein [Fontimonas thermophila]|nr:SlyX family protein [Fontimonas thermophila]